MSLDIRLSPSYPGDLTLSEVVPKRFLIHVLLLASLRKGNLIFQKSRRDTNYIQHPLFFSSRISLLQSPETLAYLLTEELSSAELSSAYLLTEELSSAERLGSETLFLLLLPSLTLCIALPTEEKIPAKCAFQSVVIIHRRKRESVVIIGRERV